MHLTFLFILFCFPSLGAVGRIPETVQETLGSGLVSDLTTLISKSETYSLSTNLVKTEGESQTPPRKPEPPQRTLCRPEYTESEKPLNPQRYLDLPTRMSMEDFDTTKVLPDCYFPEIFNPVESF